LQTVKRWELFLRHSVVWQGSAEALVTPSGNIKRLLTTYFQSNISTEQL